MGALPPTPSNLWRTVLIWAAALAVSLGLLGLALRWMELRSRTAQEENRIWISDGHRDLHGLARNPTPR